LTATDNRQSFAIQSFLNDRYQTSFEISARRHFYTGGHQSFRNAGFLPANNAAVSARAFVFDLSERLSRNGFRNRAFAAEILAPRRVGNNFTFDRGFSGEHFYGDEHAVVSRHQPADNLSAAADTNRFNRVGVLAHQRIMVNDEW